MTDNAMVIWNNRAKDSLAADSYVGDMLPENVLNNQATEVCRSSSASQVFWGALSKTRVLEAFSLWGHNISAAGTARLVATAAKDGRTDIFISNATYAAGVVTITSVVHGLATGDWIVMRDVLGMTDLNGPDTNGTQLGRLFEVTKIDENTFSIPLTTAQTYVAGGVFDQHDVQLDQTWNPITPDYGWGEGMWGEIDPDNIGGFADPAESMGQNGFAENFAAITVTHWVVFIADSTNADGYIDVGNLLLGPAFRPEVNVQPNPSDGPVDNSVLSETLAGSSRVEPLPVPRVMNMQWRKLSASEKREANLMTYLVGRRSVVLVALRPGAGTTEEKDTTLLAWVIAISKPQRRSDLADDFWEVTMTFKEAL